MNFVFSEKLPLNETKDNFKCITHLNKARFFYLNECTINLYIMYTPANNSEKVEKVKFI